VSSNTGSATFQQPGSNNTVTLSGTDANSNTGSATQYVNVTNPVSCIFNITPDAGFSPLTVNATGSCTSSTGTINSGNISINWGDGTAVTAGSSGPHIYRPATPPTNFFPQITATDSNVINGSAFQTVEVAASGGGSCTLTISPGSGQSPLNVTANLSCTPPIGVAFSSGTIDWGDGTTVTTVTGPTFSTTHTYLRSGTESASVSVTFGTTTVFATQSIFVASPTPTTPAVGDVYISTDVGLVERYSATGTLAQLFETTTGNQLGQMAFDTSRNLYVANFNGGDGGPNALEFDPAGNESFFIVSNLFNANSFAFDKAGNAYQGGSGGAIEQFDANGQPRTTFTVAVDPTSPSSSSGEVNYLDLAADQCTIYYTSRGTQIKGFNICTNKQLATDFADNIGTPASPTAGPVSFANELRIRPNGEILLADSDFVIRFAANGTVMQKYSTPAGKNTFTGLSLAPDETSFWTSQATGEIDHFDIATGNLLSSFQTPFGIGEAIAVLGEIRAATNQGPTCTLSVVPNTGVNPLAVTVTGNCTDPTATIISTTLDLGDGTTQTAPSGTHTYTSAGTFTVKLSATDANGPFTSVTQSVTVAVNQPPTCTLMVAPATGVTPLNVTATGNCTDPENDIINTKLDYGDGATQTATSGAHSYTKAGVFTVTLTATDVAGQTAAATQMVTVSANNFPQGVFIGVSGGKIMQFSPNGTALQTLDTTLGGTIADMAFDKAGNLYSVDFTAAKISKFNLASGTLSGTFGSGYNCQPETMVFDGAGNVYVGQQGCAQTILKFDPNGNFLTSYQVAIEAEGSDDLALSGDECTMLYTSEGPSILRYDVCQKKQLAPFATGLNKTLALKILPDGGVLVADLTDIVRLNSSGQRVTTYTVPNQNCLYGIALDQDGTTFWADDYCSSNVDHIDINSGKVLSTFNTGTPSGTVFGLAIAGSGLNVAGVGNGGTLTASPQSATLGAGQSATFTVTFIPNAAAAGRTLVLSCAGLPPGLSCSFNPPTITLGAAGTSSTATLTITRTMTAALFHPSSPWMSATWMGVVPAIVLMGFRSPRRRRSSMLCLALIIAATGIWAGCGSRGSSSMTTTPATPPGSYTIIVVGNASGVQASTTVNVTAQ
jgi:PKD repeat protein